MRWVLPGGAVLGKSSRGSGELSVVCRPGAAVLESMRPPPRKPLLSRMKRLLSRNATFIRQRFFSEEHLPRVKLWLEVLVLLVGLIGAILALLGVSRK